MQFNPPRYEWTAKTAKEALTALEAARDLIDSHMKTLRPNGGVYETARTAPTGLRLALDLSGLVELINDQHTVKAMEAMNPGLSELGLPD